MFSFKRIIGFDVASSLARAEKYQKLGKLGMARLELERALENTPLGTLAQREKIQTRLDGLAPLENESAEAQAEEAHRRGDYCQAKYYLNIALSKLKPADPAHQALMEQLRAIPEILEEAEIEDELDSILRAEVGIDFLDRQRTLEFWKSGFPPYKEDYYFKKALTSDMIQALATQVKQTPDDPDACFNFGVTLAQLGLASSALDQIRRYVGLRPDDRDGHYFLANLLAGEAQDDEAIREFEKTIELDPEFPDAYYYLAECFASLGDFERAEKLYSFLVEKVGDNEIAEEARAKLTSLRQEREADSLS